MHHAQASIDWVYSQLPSFSDKLESWLKDNVVIQIEENPAPATHNTIVALEKSFLPLFFNVEFGAYINAIRSSLDLLASALAQRHGFTNIKQVQFPIAPSREKYLAEDYNGAKFIKSLPATERAIIDSLQPYQGGNDKLCLLHDLDIQRKHRRLLDVEMRPLRLTMAGVDFSPEDYTPVAVGSFRVLDKTVIGLLRKGAPNIEMRFMPIVAVAEPGLLVRKPVTAAVLYVAEVASNIIKLFDY